MNGLACCVLPWAVGGDGTINFTLRLRLELESVSYIFVATSSFLLLVVRPGARSSFLFLVVRPGAPSSDALVPSSDALVYV